MQLFFFSNLVLLHLMVATAHVARSGPRGVEPSSSSSSLRLTTSNRRGLDEDSTSKSSPKKKVPSKRKCDFETKTDKMEFECESTTVVQGEDSLGDDDDDDDDDNEEDGEIADEIKFKIEAKRNQALKVKVEYENEVQLKNNETETTTKFEIQFPRLIEYRKAPVVDDSSNNSSTAVAEVGTVDAATADMAYDWENDLVVTEWLLNDWSNGFSNVVETDDLITFDLVRPGDMVQFSFTIAKTDTVDVTANKMKIDFDLLNFPWTSDDTYVALICVASSEKKIEVEFEEEEEESDDDDDDDDDSPKKKKKDVKDIKISFDEVTDTFGFTPFGEYTWAETALALAPNATSNSTNATNTIVEEGDTISVIATSPVITTDPNMDSTENMIAFSFVGAAAQSASEIYWDPEAGIGYSSALDAGQASSAMVLTGLMPPLVVGPLLAALFVFMG